MGAERRCWEDGGSFSQSFEGDWRSRVTFKAGRSDFFTASRAATSLHLVTLQTAATTLKWSKAAEQATFSDTRTFQVRPGAATDLHHSGAANEWCVCTSRPHETQSFDEFLIFYNTFLQDTDYWSLKCTEGHEFVLKCETPRL